MKTTLVTLLFKLILVITLNSSVLMPKVKPTTEKESQKLLLKVTLGVMSSTNKTTSSSTSLCVITEEYGPLILNISFTSELESMTITQQEITGKLIKIMLAGKPLMVNLNKSVVVITNKFGVQLPLTTSITEKVLTLSTFKVLLGPENPLTCFTYLLVLWVKSGLLVKMVYQT